MFLVISNPWMLNGQEEATYKGNYVQTILRLNPELLDIVSSNIEEILVYSVKKEDALKEAKIGKIKIFYVSENSIQIRLDQSRNIDTNSQEVNRAVYAYWKRSGKMKSNEYTPYITLVQDYSDYSRIKNGRAKEALLNQSLMAKVDNLKQNKDWEGIVATVSDWNTVESQSTWKNGDYLGELAYALSQIINWLYKKKAF